MEQVSFKQSICTSMKYWYAEAHEANEHCLWMKSKGFRKTGTKYNVGRVKGMDKGYQITYVKYEEMK